MCNFMDFIEFIIFCSDRPPATVWSIFMFSTLSAGRSMIQILSILKSLEILTVTPVCPHVRFQRSDKSSDFLGFGHAQTYRCVHFNGSETLIPNTPTASSRVPISRPRSARMAKPMGQRNLLYVPFVVEYVCVHTNIYTGTPGGPIGTPGTIILDILWSRFERSHDQRLGALMLDVRRHFGRLDYVHFLN